ncbi:MAG: ATP synthase subunit I [Ghiorsea sp.]
MKDVPNVKDMAKDGFQVLSVLIWQTLAVLIASLVFYVFILSWSSVLFGGLIVVMSTWHVHRSVNQSPDDRGALLQAAGVRFFLFLSVLAVGIYYLQLDPVIVIAGMATAYVALYVRSFILIFKKMKGDGLG